MIVKLPEYLGLRDKWPPPAKPRERGLAQLEHCRDVLVRAFWQDPRPSGPTPVTLLTRFEKQNYIREISFSDKIMARVFCEFLNKHAGKNIGEISELDVTFLG